MKELLMISSNRITSHNEGESIEMLELILVSTEPAYRLDEEKGEVKSNRECYTNRICIAMDKLPIVIQDLAGRWKEWKDGEKVEESE